MADLPLLGDDLRRRLALERDRQLGIDPGEGNDRGYAFNQWLPVSTNKVGSASWVQQGADPKLAVPEALQGGLLGAADLYDSPRTGKLTLEALGSLLTGSTLGGGLLAPKGSLAAGGSIKGYHGSPHDFDRFDFSKIGTGEGAQAYGHGLYIAENEGVARGYRDQISGNAGNTQTPLGAADRAMGMANGDRAKALDALQNEVASIRRAAEVMRAKGRNVPDVFLNRIESEYLPAIEMVKGGYKPGGHMYEVNIKADPQKFLDWDKPLSQQSPVAQKAVDRGIDSSKDARVIREVLAKQGDPSGEYVYRLLRQAQGSPDLGSQQLAREGIPGIKYLDQGSRGSSGGELIGINKTDDGFKARIRVANRTGTGFQTPTTMFTDSMPFKTEAEAAQWANDKIKGGTSNYVVFPTQEEIIQILRKYGLAAPSPVVPGAQGAPTTPGLLSDQQSEIPIKDRVY